MSSFDLTPFTSEKKLVKKPSNVPLLSLHSLEAANQQSKKKIDEDHKP
jgi:hypothetical protein